MFRGGIKILKQMIWDDGVKAEGKHIWFRLD
jgi:hypothetical protein